MSNTNWPFDWGNIRGELSSLGGMLGPVWFTLDNGRQVQPMAVAPWADDPEEQLGALPPILHRLRGEFPCVPFGVPTPRSDLPAHWMKGVDTSINAIDSEPHGYSANHHWHLVEQNETAITIAISYPENHPVQRLERCIAHDGELGLNISLRVEMRDNVHLPIGLHPIFALPKKPGSALLTIPSLQSARTFPVSVEENSILLPDQNLCDLHNVKTLDGQGINMTNLPLPQATEELIAVAVEDGNIRLSYPEDSYSVSLNWNAGTFSQCLLWVSNRGRQYYPWNGRFNAIGIEPIASAFDLGVAHSGNKQSPLKNLRPTVALDKDNPFETHYAIRVASLCRPFSTD